MAGHVEVTRTSPPATDSIRGKEPASPSDLLEIGHNLGAAHDEYEVLNGGNLWPGYFDYSYGHVTEPWHPSLSRRRTVMAYRTYCDDQGYACPRIPHFSNPSVSYMGNKTGAARADNARTIDRTGYYVSRHRPLTLPRPPQPTP